VQSLIIKCRAVAPIAGIKIVAVVRQPGGEQGSQKDIHVTSNQKVKARRLEVGIASKRDRHRIHISIGLKAVHTQSPKLVEIFFAVTEYVDFCQEPRVI